MANLDLSQTVGGAYRGLPLFADAHCTKHFGGSPGRPLGSESGVAGPAMGRVRERIRDRSRRGRHYRRRDHRVGRGRDRGGTREEADERADCGLRTDGMTRTQTKEGRRWRRGRREGATHCDDPSLSIFIQADSGHVEW